MAGNSVEFRVVVNADGLVTGLKQVTNFGNETQKTGKKAKVAGDEVDHLNYRMNQGVVGASSAARSFSKLNQTIGGSGGGLVAAYATMAANAFAVSAAFNALREAAQVEQVIKGLEIQGARTGQALTITGQRVQELSGFTLSLGEAMQSTAQAAAAGFSTETIERITKSAADASAALGRNMPDSMDRLVKGLTKMEPELLDELGAMTKLSEATRLYSLQTGKAEGSLTGFERRTALSNAVLTELELKFGGVAEEANSTARAYDRLAATFKDTTNGILNFVSSGLAPLLSFLNQNKLALAAVGVAFLSTIKSQLAPGLASLANEQAKTAKLQEESTKKQLADINKLGSGKRKAYNELVESIKAGTQTEEQYANASNELASRKSTILAKTYKDQEKGEKLRAVQLSKLAKEEQALGDAQAASLKATREQAVASAVSATEGANLFNVVGKVKETFNETRTALSANSQAMRASGTQAGVLTSKFTLLKSQALIAGKALGSAFLNLIPVLGQFLLVISLVTEAIELLKSEQRKALEASAISLDEVVASSTRAVVELARIDKSTASLGARTEQELVVRGNAVQGLANAYEELANSIESAQRNESELSGRGVAGIFEAFSFGDRSAGNRSFFTGIAQESKVLQEAVRLDAEKSGDFFGKNIQLLKSNQQILNTETVKTFDSLSKLVPKRTFDDIIALNGGLNTILRSSALSKKVISDLASTIGGELAQATKEVTQSFKATDETLGEFNKSVIITTPYDTVVKSLDTLTNSLINLSLAAGTNIDFSGILTGLGPLLEARLSDQSRAIIDQARSSDAIVQSLRQAKDLNGSLTIEQDRQLKAEEAKLVAAKNQLPIVAANIESQRQGFLVAQATSRLLQGQVSIIQAIMTRNQLAYSQGGAGEKARLEREEQIRSLQIEGLNIQKQQIEASLRLVTAKIEEVKAQKLLNKELDISVAAEQFSASQQAFTNAQERARTMGVSAELLSPVRVRAEDNRPMFRVPTTPLSGEQAGALQEVRLASSAVERDRQRLKAAQELNGLKAQARDFEASVLNISNQISAIALQNLSTAEKKARIEKADLEVKNKIAQSDNDISNQMISNANLGERLARANQGISSSLIDGLADVNSEYLTSLNNLTNQSNQTISTLNADLEIARASAAAATGAEKTALDAIVENYRTLILREETLLKARKDSLIIQKEINLIDKIGLNTIEKRLTLLKESLSIQEKIQSTNSDLIRSQTELSNITRRLELRRQGVSDETISRGEEITNAETALKIAEQEKDMKIALIKLEFALLEAKRQQSLLDLKARLEVIDKERALPGRANAFSEERSTILSSVENLGGTLINGELKFGESIVKYADTAAAVIENGVKIAAKNLENVKFKRRASGPGDIIGEAGGITGNILKEFGVESTEALPIAGKLALTADIVSANMSRIRDSLMELGPEGALVVAIGDGIANLSGAFSELGKATNNKEMLAAGLNAASAVLSTISSITKASSDARIASIDREIAAEQKRDGKSAESIAKLQSLEKKKDDIARKSFNTQKKLMMAQAVMSTAAGIASVLASPMLDPVSKIVFAGIIGAMGAAQIAIIAGTQYQSASAKTVATPSSSISIGKRGDTVDLAKGPSANAGGEAGFIRGSQGMGTNASNFRTIGSAYGGELMRGYGNRGFVVGEKGPEVITPETPINVTPANDAMAATPVNATFNIQALDASGVQDILVSQKGNIIKMIRDAANASGQGFLEDVNVNVYTRPSVNKL